MSSAAPGADYCIGRVDTSCSIQSRNIAGSSASNVITLTLTHTDGQPRRGQEVLIMGWRSTGGGADADGTDCYCGERHCEVLSHSEAKRERVKRKFLEELH